MKEATWLGEGVLVLLSWPIGWAVTPVRKWPSLAGAGSSSSGCMQLISLLLHCFYYFVHFLSQGIFHCCACRKEQRVLGVLSDLYMHRVN